MMVQDAVRNLSRRPYNIFLVCQPAALVVMFLSFLIINQGKSMTLRWLN